MNRPWQTKNALKNLDEAITHLKTAWDEMEKTVEEKNGVPLAVAPYPPAPHYSLVAKRDYNKRYGNDLTPAAARVVMDEWLAKCKEVREKNLPAIENNKRVKEEATRYLTSLGLAASTTVLERPKGRRNSVAVQKTAGWVLSLQEGIPTHDGWSAHEQTYKDRIARIEKFAEEAQEKSRIEQAELAKKQREKANQVVLCGLIAKYGLEDHHDRDDVLDHILGLDKYLSLGHHLLENRNDWNDGPSKAGTGLYLFDAETDEDREIHDEIRGLVDDWDGDGRCFRDCTWNYDRLFSKVDSELMADYRKLQAILENS